MKAMSERKRENIDPMKQDSGKFFTLAGSELYELTVLSFMQKISSVIFTLFFFSNFTYTTRQVNLTELMRLGLSMSGAYMNEKGRFSDALRKQRGSPLSKTFETSAQP